MLIPIGHEDTTVRRLPWVTITIMGLCLAVFVATLPSRGEHLRKAGTLLQQAANYYMEHPWLEPDERLARLISSGDEETDAAMREILVQYAARNRPAGAEELRRQQEELDALVERAFTELERLPSRKLGLVPAHPRPAAWITHMFMHGGWWHLIGNLFILFLTGPFLEDAWGRPLYAAFYVASGLVAAAMFVVRYPHLDGPLIGASGAIAGVMGAFLIRFWHRRIRFFYWFGIVFRGTFTAPAWLMLGLWFLQQLTYAQAMDVVVPGTGGGGTAYWAHVWGFAFGAFVALGIRRFEVEERFIHPAIESKITVVDNAPLDRAIEEIRSGDPERGFRMLEALVRRDPRNVDAGLALWSLALERDRAGQNAWVAERLIRGLLEADDAEGAFRIWDELREFVPEATPGPGVALALARSLAGAGRPTDAQEALRTLLGRPPGEVPAGILVKAARLAAAEELDVVAPLARAAAEHPEVDPAVAEELTASVGRLEEDRPGVGEGPVEAAAAPETVPADPVEGGEPLAPPVRGPKRLKLLEAVPVRFEPEGLVIRVGERLQRVRHEVVRAVGVAGVPGAGGRPTLVVDLLLDAPWDDVAEVRSIRLWGSTFDPVRLMDAGTPLESMRALLDELLRWSGAVPLPDPESARGKPFRTFASVALYEAEVLGIGGAEGDQAPR